MIENYGMFNLHEDNDELLLLFFDKEITKEEQHHVLTVLYHHEQIIGYRIAHFIDYAKIKYSGIIFLPNRILIDVINNIIINEGFTPLAYKTCSGYIIKEIDHKKVVYALPGTFLRDETISKGHVCTNYDLYNSEGEPDAIFIIEDEIKEGADFFKTEAK